MKKNKFFIFGLFCLLTSNLMAQHTYHYFVYDGINVSDHCCFSDQDIKNQDYLFMRWPGYYSDKKSKNINSI